MSTRRPAAPPPEIPGFHYVDVLGSGGFADVYRYEQELPRRQVAIKVMLADGAVSDAAQFTAEANVMAMLSSHPAIVTVLQAGVAADERPYLVMEYCPGPNLQVRYRREPLSVAETLRIGIPIAGAVETAHRAGVLHRDIKPANILVTEYGRPALTDFGIAATAHAPSEATGMSIPWSPPEAFGDVQRSAPRSDVYQLGATLYTLLAGRSPFEIPGRSNGTADVVDRIQTLPLPRLDRPDVPESLQEVLAKAMARRMADRHPTALALARDLQRIQAELGETVTPIDIIDERPVAERGDDSDGGRTRVRGVVSIEPQAAGAASVDADTVLRGAVSIEPVDATVIRPPYSAKKADAPRTEISAERARARWPWITAAVVVGLAAVGVVAAGIPALLAPPEPQETTATIAPQDPVAVVPAVEELTGEAAGDEVVFTWTNPDPEEGDSYIWDAAAIDEEPDPEVTQETSVTVPARGAQTCLTVTLRRANGTSSADETACVGG
ncbi:serine/threonine-protein kinase [Microbacterium sp. NPDC055683]